LLFPLALVALIQRLALFVLTRLDLFVFRLIVLAAAGALRITDPVLRLY
jgi:hypothetical protein